MTALSVILAVVSSSGAIAVILLSLRLSGVKGDLATSELARTSAQRDLETAVAAAKEQASRALDAASRYQQEIHDLTSDLEVLRHDVTTCSNPDAVRSRLDAVLLRAFSGTSGAASSGSGH